MAEELIFQKKGKKARKRSNNQLFLNDKIYKLQRLTNYMKIRGFVKVFSFVLFILLLTSLISAMTFDNRIKTITDKVVVIDDNFGFGGDLVRIEKLSNTDICYSECNTIWNVTIYDDEDDFLSLMEFKDINNKKVNKEFKYEILKGLKEIEVEDYETTCNARTKEGNTDCTQIITGNHIEYEEIWEIINPKKLSVGSYIIKMTGYKKIEESIDWIPTFYGKKITQWDWWVSVAPIIYYEMNETVNDTGVIDSIGTYTTLVPNGLGFLPGKIANAGDFNGTTYFNSTWDGVIPSGGNITMVAWVKSSGSETSNFVRILNRGVGAFGLGAYSMMINTTGGIRAIFRSDSVGCADATYLSNSNSSFTAFDNEYHRVVITRDGNSNTNSLTMYIDNIAYTSANMPSACSFVSEVDIGSRRPNFGVGADAVGDATFTGIIDDVQVYDYAWTTSDVNADFQNNTGISINLNSPEDNFNSSIENINFTMSSSVGVGTIDNVSFWSDYSGLWELNETVTGFSESSITFGLVKTIKDGMNWTYESCDTNGNCIFASANRTIFFDLFPPSITINSPTSLVNYGLINYSLTLNWSVSDSALQSLWFNYNGTNQTVFGANNITNFTIESFENRNLTFYANDSFGNENSTFINWTYEIFEINQSFNTPVIELSEESFELFISSAGTITEALFNYNGTDYISSILSLGGGLNQITTTIQIPNLDTNTNITFFYNISTDSIDNIITQNQSQEVRILNVGDCITYSEVIMNLSLFDEKLLTPLNGTIEFDLEILNADDLSILNKLSTTFENIETTSVCTDTNITGGDYVYSLELRYFAEFFNSSIISHVPEFYHIQEADISNLPQEIDLFDLAINESTEFTIFYRDNDYIARENVLLLIQRKYVDEGIFRVIEIPITSNQGSAVGHFDLNNYKYRITVTDGGEVLNTFDNPSIRCESELSGICEIRLKGSAPTPAADFVSDLIGFYYTVDLTNSSVIVDFAIPSGESETVNIVMVQTSPFADPIIICNQTVLSSAGQVECDVTSTIGDSLVSIVINSGGTLKANLKASFQEELFGSFLLNNYFIGAVILMTLVMMVVSSPPLMIVATVFGFIFLGFIFVLKASTIGLALGAVSWILVAAIIILIKLNRKAEQ